MLKRVVGVLALLVGCGTTASVARPVATPAFQPEAVQPTATREPTRLFSPIVTPYCAGRSTVPGILTTIRAGSITEQPCGLISAVTSTIGSKATFAAKHCQGAAPGECMDRYAEMHMARLRERYTMVDENQVEQHCTAYPDECEKLDSLEIVWLSSHNQNVMLEMARRARVEADQLRQQAHRSYL